MIHTLLDKKTIYNIHEIIFGFMLYDSNKFNRMHIIKSSSLSYFEPCNNRTHTLESFYNNYELLVTANINRRITIEFYKLTKDEIGFIYKTYHKINGVKYLNHIAAYAYMMNDLNEGPNVFADTNSLDMLGITNLPEGNIRFGELLNHVQDLQDEDYKSLLVNIEEDRQSPLYILYDLYRKIEK